MATKTFATSILTTLGLFLFLGMPVVAQEDSSAPPVSLPANAAGLALANEKDTDFSFPETPILSASQDTSPSPSESSTREGDTWRFSLTPHLWLPSQSGFSSSSGVDVIS